VSCTPNYFLHLNLIVQYRLRFDACPMLHVRRLELLVDNSQVQRVREVTSSVFTLQPSQASEEGNTARVLTIIRDGSEVCTASRTSALHLATREGHADVVRRLVTSGADIWAADDQGWTAVHWAAQEGHAELVEAFLTGSMMRATDDVGTLALQSAADAGGLASGKRGGYSALDLAARGGHFDVVSVLESALA
jgi:ankyrin repeat protein